MPCREMRQVVVIGQHDREDGGFLGAICLLLPNEKWANSDGFDYDIVKGWIKDNLPLQNIMDNFGSDLIADAMDDLDMAYSNPMPCLTNGDLNGISYEGNILLLDFSINLNNEEGKNYPIRLELIYEFLDIILPM